MHIAGAAICSLQSGSEGETCAAARRLAPLLLRGDVVLLSGPLGAGKTVFARSLAEALGVRGAILSPTFVIVREYPAADERLAFYHVDLYRIDADSFRELGYADEIGEDGMRVIEWGEKALELFEEGLMIELEPSDSASRLLTIRALGSRGDRLAKEFCCALAGV